MRKSMPTIEDFQDNLERFLEEGTLPLIPNTAACAHKVYEAYLQSQNSYARHALLISCAKIISMLRLEEPSRRFEKIIKNVGIPKQFACNLLRAYAHKRNCGDIFRSKQYTRLILKEAHEEDLKNG
jgi:hypothetical protein